MVVSRAGTGLVAAVVTLVRSRLEQWSDLLSIPSDTSSQRRAESETWQYGCFTAAVGGGLTYVLGLVIGLMQPVHASVAILGAAVAYPLGLALWTPQTRVGSLPAARRDHSESRM